MDSPILKEITKFLHERKIQRRNTMLFACIALIVVIGTAAALRLIGQAMTKKEKVLVCELQIHEHDKKDCYDDKNLICGFADYVVHAHNDDCYSPTGELVCRLPEIEAHEHTGKCYGEEEVLTCTEEESEGHSHSDDCYETVQGDPACGMDEHQHEDGCYDEEGGLACDKEEHEHSEDCCEEEEILACDQEEGAGGHTHDDTCYEKREILTCGELELHIHGEKKCYDEDDRLICDKAVLEEHVHSEEMGCFEIREAVTEADIEREYFSEESKTEESGGEDSASEDSVSEGSASEEAAGGKIDEKKPADVTATESSEGTEEEKTIFTTEENTEDNTQEKQEDNEENSGAGEEALDVSATQPEEVITKTCENERYLVTAAYTVEAEIPEEAQLLAQQITLESGRERYTAREEQYRKTLGNKDASMKALFKIGFYLDGVEIEPKAPVTITVQLFGENGLPEGEPVTVVHFAEDGEEVLDGGQVENGSAQFQMDSFSEVAIGTGVNKNTEGAVNDFFADVDETGVYENDSFHVTLHIRGRAWFPEERTIGGAGSMDDDPVSSGATAAPAADEDGAEIPVTGEDEAKTDISEENGAGVFAAGENVGGAAEPSGETLQEKASRAADAIRQKLELEITPINENMKEYEKEYAAATACGEELGGENEGAMLEVLNYSLSYDGVKLDLSDCEVTAEIEPTQSLIDRAKENIGETPEGEEVDSELTLTVIGVERADAGKSGEKVNSHNGEVSGEVSDGASEAEVNDSGAAIESEMSGRIVNARAVKDMSRPMEFSLEPVGEVNTFAATATSQANPNFTVEFYANINRFAEVSEGDSMFLSVIDTSGGHLPTNGGNMPKKKIKIDQNGVVKMKTELTEIYSAESHEYILAPGMKYFNKIARNDNYELQQILVQRKNSEEWETYDCSGGEEWHFTNKEKTKNENDDFILITADAKIRLVYKPRGASVKNGADFYDYDVSDGKIYTYDAVTKKPKEQSRGDSRVHNSGDVWYMYTNRQGINSNLKNQTFGFGNSEGTLKTTMGEITGNKGNAVNSAYGKPTFGLVTGLKDEKLVYSSGVVAPNLFNEGAANGKTNYAGDLIFRQEGDTYTLTGADVKYQNAVVSSIDGLDVFSRQQFGWKSDYYFGANDFYPMDDVPTAGSGGHDLKFGADDLDKLRNYSDPDKMDIIGSGTAEGYLRAPASDDGKNHNHYFGMHYTISFDLAKDYVGPLEYLFYGDDDMWVFLDGPGYSGKLICDIGGVHNAVGEYLNLWDYIPKGEEGSEGRYTLTFFYTERGASGSTCWMQFTVPSVSFATTKQDTGQLKIEKQVTGEETSEEFGFEIEFKENGRPLRDDYSYTKYDSKTNKKIESDILIWNDSKFTLKAGEYIVISFLPKGSTYTIREVGPVTVNGQEPGENIEWTPADENHYSPEISGGSPTGIQGEITGTITADERESICYNNVRKYELPETGGPGTIPYTMACFLCFLGAGGAGLLYRKKFRGRGVL